MARGAPTAKQTSKAAPVGGLNGKDAIANMPPTDAVMMENWFPRESFIEIRNGNANHVTGIAAAVESLLPYNGQSTSKLFAASGTAFYDVTISGAVGAAAVSGLTNAQWVSTNMQTAGGSFLYAVNGTDKPQLYDGSAWTAIDGASTPAITGVTTTLLSHVAVYKNRVWFVEKNSLRVWYLPVASIGGAAASINLSGIFKRGGTLVAIGTCSLNTAAAFDDYILFYTSEGEVAVYTGTDPSTAATWTLSGVFHTGRPVGKRFFQKSGSDMAFLTTDGVQAVSVLVAGDKISNKAAISDKIQRFLLDDLRINGTSTFGWELMLFPEGEKLILNVPAVGSGGTYQYVMNTRTGAWTKFTGWNAKTFCVFNGELYAGFSTSVAKCDTGGTDIGNTAITADVIPAYDYFGARGKRKSFSMVRPNISTDGSASFEVAMCVDFNTVATNAVTSIAAPGGTLWDLGDWDTSDWSTGTPITFSYWRNVSALGYAGALRIKAVRNNIDYYQLQSIDYIYEEGSSL
jgi:hypothetical protein